MLDSLSDIHQNTLKLFGKIGISGDYADLLYGVVSYFLLFALAYGVYQLSVIVLKLVVKPLTTRSKTYFDDLLIKNWFFRRISFLTPALLIYYALQSPLFVHKGFAGVISGMVVVFFYVIAALIFTSVLSTINDYYNRFHIAKDHPIVGIIQVLKIIVYLVALLLVIGFISGRDISSLLLGLGTLSAVLMLIFRDPILGFVGGLQLIFNKMLAIGDWITVSKYGADGTVLEINLTTVKVQNFDKTIVTVPTYSLVSDSFQNWRGMQESGGRRIKRSVNIDMESIRFCDSKMLEKFGKISLIQNYLKQKEEEIAKYNSTNKLDTSVIVNGRRQTNIGVFREYLKAYLHSRPDISDDMTFLVRHLDPTEKGLPIQLYVFTTTTDWAKYEDIQADIFDHILAVIPEFGLKVFQFPSGDNATAFIPES